MRMTSKRLHMQRPRGTGKSCRISFDFRPKGRDPGGHYH